NYWWPGLTYVKKYVHSCDTCARAKSSRKKPAGLLQPLPVPSHPFASVDLDFITDLPLSDGCHCILVLLTVSQRPDTSFPVMALQMLNLLHIFFFPQSFELMAFLIRLSVTVVPSLFLNSGLGYLNYLVLISP